MGFLWESQLIKPLAHLKYDDNIDLSHQDHKGILMVTYTFIPKIYIFVDLEVFLHICLTCTRQLLDSLTDI